MAFPGRNGRAWVCRAGRGAAVCPAAALRGLLARGLGSWSMYQTCLCKLGLEASHKQPGETPAAFNIQTKGRYSWGTFSWDVSAKISQSWCWRTLTCDPGMSVCFPV